jgi:hypothetical protein
MTSSELHRGRRAALLCTIAVAAACGSGGGETGGSGGGPGGPGGTGNPLAIVLDFAVTNGAATPRTETIRASVPFPFTGYPESALANLIVSGHQTAWLPLQLWADGTVKVAQAQFTDTLQPNERKTYVVARDEPALTGAFQRNNWVAQAWPGVEIGAEVRDTFQVPYRAFASDPGTVVQTSSLVQVKCHRGYHLPVAGQTGIGRDYLTSTFYVTEFRDMPFVLVDWVLGNDYLGADSIPAGNGDRNLRALGTVDVRGAWFLGKGATQVLPYRAAQEAIGAGEQLGGYTGFRVMQDTWLGDAQTRRYRFLLRFEANGAPPAEAARWQETATAMIQQPLQPIATQPAWEQTRAAGLLGGPIAGPSDRASRAQQEYDAWTSASWFGTWGSRGDPQATATTGTPRNHGLTPQLAHAVQAEHWGQLVMLEQLAWAQAMRPYHLWNLQVGAEQQILLWDGTPMLTVQGESLGRRALRDNDPWPQYRSLSVGQSRAHGWQHFDHEHWSMDLLFDYWTVSGDAWAREELRQLGQSLKGLMRLREYYTASIQAARAEGWCMQGFAQAYQATRDPSIKDYAMRRVEEVIEPQRKKDHPSRALCFQTNHPNTGYPMNHEFFMPWQHGAVLYGFLGAYVAFDEPRLLEIAEDVPTTVQYSWVTNVASTQFGQVANGLRYYVPASHNGTPVPANHFDTLPNGVYFGDSPLGGAHTFLIAGLLHLAELTSDPVVRTRALLYGGILCGNVHDATRWNKWWYCLPPSVLQ